MEAFPMKAFLAFSPKLARLTLGLVPAALLLALTAGARPAQADPMPQALRMSCASNDMHRHVCAADTTGGVKMVHQKSEAKCIQNSSWGFDKNGILVDHGCRAEFEIVAQAAAVVELHVDHDRDQNAHRGPDRDADRNDYRHQGEFRDRDNQFRGFGDAYMVYCASDAMERVWCPADARFGVHLIRQRSEATCIEGQTWGYGKRGIWADRGCRADFRVTGDWQSKAFAFIYCPSDYMQRNFCAADTRDGVFIVRQRSESDCVFNRTWGYDRDRIWVDRGCRADFEIVDRRDSEWREWSRDWSDDDRRGWDRDHPRDRDDYRDRDRYRDRDDRRDRRRDGDDDHDRDEVRPPSSN
jgi:hypothetical protein